MHIMKKILFLLPLIALAACREPSLSSIDSESTPSESPSSESTPSVSIPDIDVMQAFTSLRADVLAFKGELNYKIVGMTGNLLGDITTSIESIFAVDSYSYLREYDEDGTVFIAEDYADEDGYAYTYQNGEQAYYVYEETNEYVPFSDVCPPIFKMLASSLAQPQADGTLLLTFSTNEINYQYKLEILALLTGHQDIPANGDFVFTLTDGVIDGGTYTAFAPTSTVEVGGVNKFGDITTTYSFEICQASDIDFTPNFA